jgi:hypothetical protein
VRIQAPNKGDNEEEELDEESDEDEDDFTLEREAELIQQLWENKEEYKRLMVQRKMKDVGRKLREENTHITTSDVEYEMEDAIFDQQESTDFPINYIPTYTSINALALIRLFLITCNKFDLADIENTITKDILK